ncbi:hypothetical protein CYCME_1507 [Cycloclasticus zancles 78-ME]|jgi:uncharacterized protein with NRDE domain|uniref:NRDE family protein n=2 Tax=Cycloclasticus TaxID=34067 RepID=S5TG73_9GAMM|nr:hypothetical protein CYCME_1507 [Cycloclasticus zancles 78-ME]|tara:strand:+ start:904 stop:1671 length:768 start_codon:yes stop_codon:yes gene_type:complete
MCLIIFKYQPNDLYKLVLVANRDEYYQRATQAAGYWPDQPHIFGGIDHVAGGSWLSTDTSGRLAALTNVRKPPFIENTKLSRGHLVRDFLSQQSTAPDFIEKLKKRRADYGLFNLLLMDHTGLWYYSNDSLHVQQVPAGIHGLCNASLNTPWPKLSTATAAVEKSLASNKIDPFELLSTMQSRTQANDQDLPNTGISLEFERFLSPIFIQGKDYGTRCTTLLTVDELSVKFLEISYDSSGEITGDVKEEIELITR